MKKIAVKKLFALSVGYSLGLAVAISIAATPAFANKIDLLHDVPLEISAYTQEAPLPEKFTTAAEILTILKNDRNLPVHMEVLRRGYFDLSQQEQGKLLVELDKLHKSLPDDSVRFFDVGYAQLVYKNNQTGLYFLRKANDNLKNQFTSLAYALAQADVDLNLEEASPDSLTQRKLDVTYKLIDAAARDAKAHKEGFWPSFVRVLNALAPASAYQDIRRRDFSANYVPYDNPGSASVDLTQNSGTTADDAPSCDPSPAKADNPTLDWGKLYRSVANDFDGLAPTETVHFFNTPDGNEYQVLVLNEHNQQLASLDIPVSAHVSQSTDEDGSHALVIRQYAADPLHPVKLYKLKGCEYELDSSVQALFE